MPEPTGDFWLHCSACRRDILFGKVHWVCSVSTCNRNRTRLVFCSVACWDSHLSTIRHREAWAVEAIAPTRDEAARESAAEEPASRASPSPPPVARAASSASPLLSPSPVARATFSALPSPSPSPSPAQSPARSSSPSSSMAPAAPPHGPALSEHYDREVLIVVSKMKKYIKDRSGMNTSDAVADVLSEHVRRICDDAIRIAAADERKTVLDRDVPRPRRGADTP